MEKIDGLLFIDIDLFVMSYFLKLWFKVQFVEWEKYNQENLVNLVKNLQETACVEVRLHTQYFDKKIIIIIHYGNKELEAIVMKY